MSLSTLCLVEFEPFNKRIAVPYGTRLLDAALRAGINLPSACGGQRSCGQCSVVILQGRVSNPTQDEINLLNEGDLDEHHRLACCVPIHTALKVHIPQQEKAMAQPPSTESEPLNST